MKVCIIHDSKFGNGKKIAETFAKAFPNADVMIGHNKEISPKIIALNPPDLLIVGTAVRMFRISRGSKNWLKSLQKNMVKTRQRIKFGAGFVTHMRELDKISSRIEGFYRLLADTTVINQVYPKWFLGQVVDQEGPLKIGVLDNIKTGSAELINWMNPQIKQILI
ncbi:MAG: hypothetical protein ACW99A_11425 [Candidatus Kariarchaeaceae archaeon]